MARVGKKLSANKTWRREGLIKDLLKSALPPKVRHYISPLLETFPESYLVLEIYPDPEAVQENIFSVTVGEDPKTQSS